MCSGASTTIHRATSVGRRYALEVNLSLLGSDADLAALKGSRRALKEAREQQAYP
jgi:hypothetical protein